MCCTLKRVKNSFFCLKCFQAEVQRNHKGQSEVTVKQSHHSLKMSKHISQLRKKSATDITNYSTEMTFCILVTVKTEFQTSQLSMRSGVVVVPFFLFYRWERFSCFDATDFPERNSCMLIIPVSLHPVSKTRDSL